MRSSDFSAVSRPAASRRPSARHGKTCDPSIGRRSVHAYGGLGQLLVFQVPPCPKCFETEAPTVVEAPTAFPCAPNGSVFSESPSGLPLERARMKASSTGQHV